MGMYEHVLSEISDDLRWFVWMEPMINACVASLTISVIRHYPDWYIRPVSALWNVRVALQI
jgi:hypothetical protein